MATLSDACSRNRQFPPSLFGNWTTADGPSWQADYHLTYNHQGPWCGVFSSNHPELADLYDTPIESEHGRRCILQNPWPGRELTFERDGRPGEKRSGEPITFPTSPGERIVIRP